MARTTRSGQTPTSSPAPPQPKAAATPNKRAAAPSDSTPKAKRGRPAKKQKTIEETIDGGEAKSEEGVEKKDEENVEMSNGGEKKDVEKTNGASDPGETNTKTEEPTNGSGIEDDKVVAEQINGDNETKNAFDEVKSDPSDVKEAAKEEQEKKTEEINQNNTSIVEDEKREAEIPSSILEKGIIYFFFRRRVNTTDPQGVEDIARSYIVLRPLPLGAAIGSGPLEDTGNARLLALPKKVLPKSGRDKFLVFVEKASSSVKDLREQFSGNEYATQTVGTSTTEPATPFAEGIYAITTSPNNRDSHLAYHITYPSTLGNIQSDLGLTQKGSFVASAKNPQTPSPGNTGLSGSDAASYPKGLQERFGGRRWMPLVPEMLGYEGSQVLLIGEGFEGGVGEGKKEAVGEVERLEEEDHDRVENLKEDDPVFADLGLSSKEYPHLQTTW